MKHILFALTVWITGFNTSYAQTNDTLANTTTGFFTSNIDYQVRAQFSIGGSTPLGLPREIRKIERYSPTLQLGLEANATKWLTLEKKWGIRLGLKAEGKGMKTEAMVKNYLTEIQQGSSKVRGYYTGKVQTTVENTYITIPVSAVYYLSEEWRFYGGFYFSGILDQRFEGSVSEGYLRQNAPTGTKITFEEGSSATYDFSDEVRQFQWGTQLGGEWKMNRHFRLFAEGTYGFNGLLHKDFNAISFTLHNIYLNMGFGYEF